MLFDFISAALVTILVTLDPPALAPIFVSLTGGMQARGRPGGIDRLLHPGFLRSRRRDPAEIAWRRDPGLPYFRRLALVLDRVRDGVRAPQRAQATHRR